ncbi:MAG: LacI family DNA-binding transcriptional regulator [Planctomycetota bacterium]
MSTLSPESLLQPRAVDGDAPQPDPAPRPAGRGGAGREGSGKRVGIREIAQRAEVSTATVSMVLNQNPKITEATRQRVLRVIHELDYRPNRQAQALSSKYTRMLGVLMPTLRHAVADPYFGEVLSGIVDRAAKRGHKVMLENVRPDFIKTRQHIELFERRYVDGVFCVGFANRVPFLRDLVDGGYAAIAVNSVFDEFEVDHVVCDYRGGAEQVMTCLTQLGHSQIGLIHGSPDVATQRMIMEVFAERTGCGGKAGPSACMVDGLFTERGGADAAKELLERQPNLTAIFAGNDKMALGALHYAQHEGIKVPDDLSIVGFDDIPHTAFVTPALTTIHTPLYEVGALSADRLIERIRGKTGPVKEVLPTHLVLRESTSIAQPARPS